MKGLGELFLDPVRVVKDRWQYTAVDMDNSGRSENAQSQEMQECGIDSKGIRDAGLDLMTGSCMDCLAAPSKLPGNAPCSVGHSVREMRPTLEIWLKKWVSVCLLCLSSSCKVSEL